MAGRGQEPGKCEKVGIDVDEKRAVYLQSPVLFAPLILHHSHKPVPADTLTYDGWHPPTPHSKHPTQFPLVMYPPPGVYIQESPASKIQSMSYDKCRVMSGDTYPRRPSSVENITRNAWYYESHTMGT